MKEATRDRRSLGWVRGGLAFLSVGALLVGVWALSLPHSFYEGFPLSGRNWVSTLGPYDEHLVRDVGELNLALGTLLLLAAIWFQRRLVQASIVAWLVYATPHFLFHVTETGAFSLADNLAQLGILGFLVVLPAVMLVRVGLRGGKDSEGVAR